EALPLSLHDALPTFVALVAVHDAGELGLIAERVRRAIADQPMEIEERLHPMTTSLGTALARPGEPQAELLERADRALYQAKQQGDRKSTRLNSSHVK